MAEWQVIADLHALREGLINRANADGVDLILLRFGDEVFAYLDACPHEGHPLCLGELNGDVIVCAKHLWEFDARSGAHISRVRRAERDLKRLALRVFDGKVEVDLASLFE